MAGYATEGQVPVAGLKYQQRAFIRLQGEVQEKAACIRNERHGSDLVAHRVPALGHPAGLHAESKPARSAFMVLIRDEEDVAAGFNAMEHVQPVAGFALDDFEGGVDAGITGQNLLELLGRGLGRQQVGTSAAGIGLAGVQGRCWRSPNVLANLPYIGRGFAWGG